MRLDKFLKLARLVKRRSAAQEMIELVSFPGKPVPPAILFHPRSRRNYSQSFSTEPGISANGYIFPGALIFQKFGKGIAYVYGGKPRV